MNLLARVAAGAAALTALCAIAPARAAPLPAAAPSELSVTAETDRYLLADDPDRLLAEIDPASSAAFARMLRPDGSAALDHIWATLAAGAVQTRLEQSNSGETLWFNPVFDAGIAVLWRRSEGRWVAAAVTPVLGETLRGEPIDPTKDLSGTHWPQASASLAGSLSAAAQADNRAAAGGGWLVAFAAKSDLRSGWSNVVVARVFTAGQALAMMQLDRGYRNALSGLHAQLVTDDPRQLPVDVREELAKTGDAGRLSLRPVAALRRPDGWSVVLQSPDAVGAAWFAHFLDPTSGAVTRAAAFTVAPLIAAPTTPEPAR